MKFLIDAQLPFALCKHLRNHGLDIIHTDDLPNKEFTTDNEIRRYSQVENRIVITKDVDFLDSYYIKFMPQKLLLISTGNCKNRDLIRLFNDNLPKIIELFATHSFVEMNNFEIIGHE